jgi:hypothetical protein
MASFWDTVSSRCICLSAPVKKMHGRADAGSWPGLYQYSTDAASRFDDVGVEIIVGLDGANLMSASIYTKTVMAPRNKSKAED